MKLERYLSLATFSLIACGGSTPKPAPAPTETKPPPQEKVVPDAPVLKSGVDLENFDSKARAQDDFYQFVNGKWLERTVIPEDRSNFGSFTVLADAAEKNLKKIIEDVAASDAADGTDAQKIRDYFNSYMDEKTIASRGIEPLKAELAAINKLRSKKDVAAHFGRFERMGIKTPIGFYVDQDYKNTTAYIAYITQSGLGLPDRDYYFKKEDKFVGYRKAYTKYIEDILKLIGRKDAKSRAKKIMALETKLAKPQWTRTQRRDRNKSYNKRDFAALKKTARGFAWDSYVGPSGLKGQNAVIVRQPDYVDAMAKIVKKTPVSTWKMYLELRLVSRFAGLLTPDFVNTNFAFYGTTLRGIKENRPRWKRAVSALDGVLGEAVGKIYVERHFKPEAKARMKKLVDNLQKAFEGGIDSLEWMSDKTKVEAKKKLAKFTPKIGYPDKWRDYSALKIQKGKLVENAIAAVHFEHDRNVKKLGGPIDRNEWFMTPQTINAYYNPSMNEIVFPAAILQPPFFDLEADDAVNYGAIGAVIGHELSHGFDDQGRKSDGDGNLRDWWTEADAVQFKQRAKLMVDQYGKFEPLENGKVNGELTLGENIGDLGGLTIAYRAYQLSLSGKQAPKIDGYTGDQRFFIGWAQIWRRKYREAELRRRLVTDPHSPSRYRVIGVLSNMPEFYKAFSIKDGDKMHRRDGERVKIW